MLADVVATGLAGAGIYAIAEGLTRDGIPCPSAHDPGRNSHRSGMAWAKGAVRAILTNPRYTGRQVWHRQRKDEVLIDVNDVALGHETRMRWNDQGTWIWSEQITHPPVIDAETFQEAQDVLAARGRGPCQHKPHERLRDSAFTGALFCGECDRRMQGHRINAVGAVDSRHLLLVGAGPGLGMAIARRLAVGGYRSRWSLGAQTSLVTSRAACLTLALRSARSRRTRAILRAWVTD